MTENGRKRKKYAELSIEERRIKIQKSSHAKKLARERKQVQNEVSNMFVRQELHKISSGMLS